MNTSELRDTIELMKHTSVPRRLAYIWQGKKRELHDLFKGIEIHEIDLAGIEELGGKKEKEMMREIERYLTEILKKYESERSEPSVLIINNAILLTRYSCKITALLEYGISPRSMVILVFPRSTSTTLPLRAERWIKNDTASLVRRIGLQLGDFHCIIDDLGAQDE